MKDPHPKLVEVLGRLPNVKEEKMTGPDPAVAEKMCQDALSTGKDGLAGLVGTLVEAGKGEDYKARYLLHMLVLYAGRKEAADRRALIVESLLSGLGGDTPKEAQNFLIGELQAVVAKEAADKIAPLLLDEALSDAATAALTSFGPEGVEPLRRALDQAKGKCRLNIVQALGTLRDGAAAEALKKAAADGDQAVRLAAVYGLANQGDAGAIDLVLKVADGEQGLAKAQASDSCLLLAKRLAAAGRKDDAVRIYRHLIDKRTAPNERYLRNAAERAMAAS